MIKDLIKFWKEHYGDVEPLAHELKHIFKERWVRFHALPGSKRYPESEAEYQEIFSRHKTVLSDLNNSKESLLVVLPEYSESSAPSMPAPKLSEILSNSMYWRTIDQNEECGVYWHLHVAEVDPMSDKLNDMFRLVADDEVRNIMFISLESISVFHPYDGGSDIVLQSVSSRDKLKENYSSWLSQHTEGY
jgi:hypothetical protein